MSGNIPPIDKFCKDPSQYANKYPQYTLDYWQQYCDGQKGPPDIGTKIANIAEGIPDDIAMMIEGLFQPQSLKIMSAFMGINLSPKILKGMIQQGVRWTIPDAISKAAAEAAGDGASEAAINIAAATEAVVTAAVREGLSDVGAFSIETIIAGLELFTSLIDPLQYVLLGLQLISMLFDAFDPCHLNDVLDAHNLSLYNRNFDRVFRENLLVSLDSISDGYGNVIFINDWPITFTATGGVLETILEDKYAPKRMTYMAQYLNALSENSNGDPIAWPKGGTLIQTTSMDKAIRSLSMLLANDNTVVAKSIEKYIPIILSIFLGVIILLFIKYILK